MLKWLCDQMIKEFIQLCEELNIPLASMKTEWGLHWVIFLGILLDGKHSIPLEKQDMVLKLLQDISGKRKLTVKTLQVLTGFLNFLTKAIHPSRVFT